MNKLFIEEVKDTDLALRLNVPKLCTAFGDARGFYINMIIHEQILSQDWDLPFW